MEWERSKISRHLLTWTSSLIEVRSSKQCWMLLAYKHECLAASKAEHKSGTWFITEEHLTFGNFSLSVTWICSILLSYTDTLSHHMGGHLLVIWPLIHPSVSSCCCPSGYFVLLRQAFLRTSKNFRYCYGWLTHTINSYILFFSSHNKVVSIP